MKIKRPLSRRISFYFIFLKHPRTVVLHWVPRSTLFAELLGTLYSPQGSGWRYGQLKNNNIQLAHKRHSLPKVQGSSQIWSFGNFFMAWMRSHGSETDSCRVSITEPTLVSWGHHKSWNPPVLPSTYKFAGFSFGAKNPLRTLYELFRLQTFQIGGDLFSIAKF